MVIHTINLTLSKLVRLTMNDLQNLGVNIGQYGKRDYSQTQKIGSAISFLECDGLIAPSARWDCENAMIYTTNHSINESCEVIQSTEYNWQEWAKENGIIN